MYLSELKPGMIVVFKDTNSNIGSPLDHSTLETNAHLLAGKEAMVVLVRDPSKYPGKYLGLCFKNPVTSGHTCDGLVKDNHGYWALPEDVSSKEEFTEHMTEVSDWLSHRKSIQDLLENYI